MILGHSVTYFSARLVSGVINILTISLLTQLLPPAEYGRYALMMAAIGLVSNVMFGWLGSGLVRFLTLEHERQKISTAVLSTWFCLNLCISAITIVLIGVLEFAEWRHLVLQGICLLWAQTWYELCLEAYRGSLVPSRYGLMQTMSALIKLVVGIGGVQAGWGASGALMGAFCGYGIPSLLFKPAVLHFRLDALTSQTLMKLTRYGLPISLNSSFLMIVHFSDRFLIAALLGEAAAGVYAAAYDLAQQSLALVLRSLGGAIPPLIFRAVEQGNHEKALRYMERNFQLLGAIGALTLVILWMTAPHLCTLVLGEAFREAALPILPVVALATFIVGLRTHHFLLPFLIQRSTSGLIVSSFLAALVNLGLNLWWIPSFGILGAAWATLCAYVVSLASVFAIGSRLFSLPSFVKDSIKIGLGALVASGAMAWVSPPLDLKGLLIETVVGCLTYAAALGILYWPDYKQSLANLRKIWLWRQ